MGVYHDYKVAIDNDGYFLGFEARDGETGTYNFDGSSLELEYLNAYKIVSGQPFLDENKKAEIIAQKQADELAKQVEAERLPAQVTYTAMMTDTLLEE